MDQKGGWLIRGKPCLLPVVPARGGVEVALKIYIRPFSSIELACAVRQPSPCVRALCETGVLFHMSHFKLHFTLHTWQSSHSTLHTSHCTLHTAPFAVNTSLHTVLLRLHTSHFTLHTSHFTLHSSPSKLHTSHSTLHTSHCTKQPWRSHSNAICRDWVAKHNRTTCNGVGNCSSKTGWISTPKWKKDDFEALFKRNFKRKIISAKIGKICWQMTIAAWMQPLQYDLQSSAAKDNSITHAAAAASNLDAATPMRSESTDSKTPYNYAHTSTPKAAWSHRYTAAKKNDKPTAAAPAAQTRYLSSSPAATMHGKTQGFVLRLPPQNRALATSCSHSNAICKHRFQNTL